MEVQYVASYMNNEVERLVDMDAISENHTCQGKHGWCFVSCKSGGVLLKLVLGSGNGFVKFGSVL